jgi:hypothetical protein
LQIIQNARLVFSKKKLKLFEIEIKYLGHIINNGELVLQSHVVEFADKLPDKIIDKLQIQRFLGSLNYISHFYKHCAQDRKMLNDRLKKEASP